MEEARTMVESWVEGLSYGKGTSSPCKSYLEYDIKPLVDLRLGGGQ